MFVEYHYIDGTLRSGYFCVNCGQTCNMYAIQHIGRVTDTFMCKPNRALVAQLYRANPPTGIKPHFVRQADVK